MILQTGREAALDENTFVLGFLFWHRVQFAPKCLVLCQCWYNITKEFELKY